MIGAVAFKRGKQLKFHPPFLFLATVVMLVGCLDCRTQF
jgi:hypothetical protein